MFTKLLYHLLHRTGNKCPTEDMSTDKSISRKRGKEEDKRLDDHFQRSLPEDGKLLKA